jgi:MFS-type transporter involved in bile tolerance (Atg22 family)
MHAKPQFSLRAGLIAVTFCCFAVAGLAYPNAWWASAWFSYTLGTIVVATLGTIYARRVYRAFWLGFCLVATAYLAVLYAPLFDTRVGFRLFSTRSLAAVQKAWHGGSSSYRDAMLEIWIERSTPLESDMMGWNQERQPQWESFQLIGHSVLAQLFACCGGLYAARLYEKNWTRPE